MKRSPHRVDGLVATVTPEVRARSYQKTVNLHTVALGMQVKLSSLLVCKFLCSPTFTNHLAS